jgi:hypothetical protein
VCSSDLEFLPSYYNSEGRRIKRLRRKIVVVS